MKHKQRFLRILGFVLMLVLFGALPQASAPEENLLLVPYLLTWHAKALGSGYHQSGGGEMTSELAKYSAEMSGSAIVRFRFVESAKRFWHYDTRFLSLVVSDNYDRWETNYRDPAMTSSPAGNASTHFSLDIPGKSGSANSGLYIPPKGIDWGVENPLEKRADGVTVMHEPFSRLLGLRNLRFDVHSHLSATQWTVPHLAGLHPGESPWFIDPPESDHTNEQAPDASDLIFGRLYDLADPKFDLQAVSPNDESSFALNTRFSVVDTLRGGPQMTIDVVWTAQAHRLGKCPCAVRTSSAMMSGLAWDFQQRTGPTGSIPADDQNMQTVDVTVTTDKTPIDPDSNTKVHIRVTTCDGIPVEGLKGGNTPDIPVVEIKVEPQDSSGSHIHTNHRPRGKLNGQDMDTAPACTNPQGQGLPGTHCITLTTDDNGEVNGSKGITFAPPGKAPNTRCVGLAGDYQVTATSKRFPDRKATAMIHVGFNNITSHLSQVQNYNVCADSSHPCHADGPWGTDTHPDSENGTPTTIQAFKKLAADFQDNQQFFNTIRPTCGGNAWPVKKVSFNDIALPEGGLFDVAHNWKPTPKGHQTHGKGQGGDFNHFGETCPNCKKCGGIPITKAQFNTWLEATMRMTGEPKYGKWDHADLTAVPPKLHLHVDDLVQGVVPPPPASCPADD